MKLNIEYTGVIFWHEDIKALVEEIARQMAKVVNMSEIDDDASHFHYDDFEVKFEDDIVFYLTGAIQKNYKSIPQEEDGSRYELTVTYVDIRDIGATIEGEEITTVKVNDKKLEDLIPMIEEQLKNML